MDTLRRSEALWWTSFAGLVALTLAIVWTPIGFNGWPGPELWSCFHTFEHGASWFEAANAGRVFERLPLAIGRWLDPDSFAGLHIVLVLLVGAKPLLAAAVLRRIGCDRASAAAGGLLLLLFPGDDALLMARFVAYHFAVVLMLLALVLWLAASERPRVPLAAVVLVGLLSAMSLLSVEALLPLALLAPLLLMLRRPVTPWRRWWPTTAAWLVAPLGVVLWQASRFGRQHSYQKGSLGNEALAERLIAAALAIPAAVGHLLLGAWLEAARLVSAAPVRDLAAAALLGILAAAFIAREERVPVAAPTGAVPSMRRGAALAAAILVLSYAPFAFLPAHRHSTLRVYLAAMVGAAPLLVLFLRFIASRAGPLRREFFAAAAGLLFACGAVAALAAQRSMAADARVEQQLFSDILSAVPVLPHEAAILLSDPHRLLLREGVLGWSLTDGHVCDVVRFFHRRLDFLAVAWKGPQRPGFAAEVVPGERAVRIKHAWGDRVVEVPYERVAFVELGADGRARLRPLPAEFGAAAAAAYSPETWPRSPPPGRDRFLRLAVPGLPPEEPEA